ncbi:MAG: portal protein, partial [bacterium]
MAGKTIDVYEIIEPDNIAKAIADRWVQWENMRSKKKEAWKEIRQYIFATDTSTTSNSSLPWKNKTHVPKICQIRDNLYANYMAAMFPKRDWMKWEGDTEDDDDVDKSNAIVGYMGWATDQKFFKEAASKLVLDYIDYGNCFGQAVWEDKRPADAEPNQAGFVGPRLRRISPLDITFNPTAPSFEDSPKIVRDLYTLGELKKYLTRISNTADEEEEYLKIFDYVREVRHRAATSPDLTTKDEYLNVDGFTSFQQYLDSSYVEVLTFYGDLFLEETNELYENHIIMIVDRHKLIARRPNPSQDGTDGIHHVGWRIRQDNLWAMGPLDNLIGLQYRIDHLENLKADLMDLTVFPLLKIRGYVEDFEYAPMERVYVGDDG